MFNLTTEGTFHLQAKCVFDVLGLFLNLKSMVVCTTRHCQTSGRLVQELNVCTVSWTWCSCYSVIVSMGVCTTRHCQTSGRLVQELNICTVGWTWYSCCSVHVIVSMGVCTTRYCQTSGRLVQDLMSVL